MLQTLNTYPNLYLNPIEIPDYTIVEIYKDTIALANGLGYCIVPLGDKDNNEIKAEIANRIQNSQPVGYSNSVILAGRTNESFSNRITYVVWYQGSTVPTFPDLPKIEAPIDPKPAFDRYNKIEVTNQGAAASDVVITLSVVAVGEVSLLINDKSYSIIINKLLPNQENKVVISKDGVTFNDKNYDNFTFAGAPTLKKGVNSIAISKENVNKIKIDYVPKY